jgi:hypothetical protein
VLATGTPHWEGARTPTALPAIQFNGTNDFLQRINSTAAIRGLPAGNTNRTMFLIAKYDAASLGGGVAYGNGANNQAFGVVVKASSGELALQGFGNGNDLTSTVSGIGAGWLLQSAVLSNGVAILYKNGVEIARWSHSYNTVLSKLVIAAEIKRGFVGMEVAAVLVYDRALSPSEQATVESYLQNKYLQPASAKTDAQRLLLDGLAGTVGELKLRIVDFKDGTVRLLFPELKPNGNYHLHAVKDLANEVLSDPANRIHTITKAQIAAMSAAEQRAVTFNYPADKGSVFFQLFFQPAK